MKGLATAALALLCVSACAATEATPQAGPSAGKVSLQTAPYSGDATSAPPAPQAPAVVVPEAEAPSFETIAAKFDPGRQHFIWVLPPGIHGKEPWDFTAVVKLRDEPKFTTSLPLKAELLTPASRPEFPAGYEIVRLTDDGQWANRTAELDRVIQALIAEHGRGHGAVEMTNELNISIDAAHRQTYCAESKYPDIRLYLEDDGASTLIRLDAATMASVIQPAVKKACG